MAVVIQIHDSTTYYQPIISGAIDEAHFVELDYS